MPRKRFSAFEDFPAENGAQEQSKPSSLFPEQPVQPGAQPHILSQPEAPEVERIERLKPSQMIPDRFQPRRLLPTTLRQPFYSGQIDCYEAARKWLQMAKNDSSIQAEVDRLMSMGSSFTEHGQIKPITGSWQETNNGEFRFVIETGERRFWAACLQRAAQGLKDEPLLRVEVVNNPTRMRQVLENRHAEPPSAVGQACEVASLILAELGITPADDTKDEFEYFRQARDRRMPPGLWEKIMPVMNLTRPRLVQLLNILDLPTPLLDLADRYRVPERVLREVVAAPREQWEPVLRTSIQNNMTSDDVAELTQRPKSQSKSDRKPGNPPDLAQQAINAMKKFTYTMEQLDEDIQAGVMDELANDFVVNERADGLVDLMHDLAERIRIRQQNRYRRR